MLTITADVFSDNSGSGSTSRLGQWSNIDAIRLIAAQAQFAVAQLKQTRRPRRDHPNLCTVMHTQISHARYPRRIADHLGHFRLLITLQAFER